MTLKTYPASPSALAFPPLKGAEMEALKKSLLDHGQQFPIILYDGEIVDGRNRQEAFGQLYREKKLKPGFQFWTETLRELTPVEYAKVANLDRRHMSSDQRAGVASKLLPLLQKEAKARQAAAAKATNAARKRGEKKAEALSASGRRAKPKTAAAEAAAVVGGVSERSVQRFERVRKAEPALAKKVLDGEIDLTQAERKIRREVATAQAEEYVPPAGEFGLIVVDFPWKHDDAREGSSKARNGADYPRMTIEQILAFPLPVAESCLLACWITNSHLIDGTWEKVRLSLLHRYGFIPKQMRTWTKTEADGGEKTGLGKAFRNDTEHCIMLERGRVVYRETGADHDVPILRTSFSAPAGRGSEKPDVSFEHLLAICPHRPALEMFAREPRDGWVTTGSELAPGDSTGEGEGGRSGVANISPVAPAAVETFSPPAGSATTPELTVERVPDETPPEIQTLLQGDAHRQDFDF